MKQCEQCNEQFKPKRSGSKTKFCSRDCYVNSKQPTLNKCLQCGSETNTKFCSRSCSASYNNTVAPKRQKTFKNTCETCNKPTNNKRWCSLSCRPKETYRQYRSRVNEANARYMARRKYQTPADENISALQEFYANCPIGYEVDHIIPISKGGLHSLSNLQYLPWLENRRKSNKV